jgi:hypothetical protein
MSKRSEMYGWDDIEHEREQCCKDVCERCRESVPVCHAAWNWRHENGKRSYFCKASSIRERAYQEDNKERTDR